MIILAFLALIGVIVVALVFSRRIYRIEEEVDGLTNSQASLSRRVTTVEAGLSARVAKLETDATSLTADLARLAADAVALTTRVAKLEKDDD